MKIRVTSLFIVRFDILLYVCITLYIIHSVVIFQSNTTHFFTAFIRLWAQHAVCLTSYSSNIYIYSQPLLYFTIFLSCYRLKKTLKETFIILQHIHWDHYGLWIQQLIMEFAMISQQKDGRIVLLVRTIWVCFQMTFIRLMLVCKMQHVMCFKVEWWQ